MAKYLVKRLLRGIVSVVIVVTIVMLLIYTLMDRDLIFARDAQYTKRYNNDRVLYRYTQWERFGYLDYVSFGEYLTELARAGEIDEETHAAAVAIGRRAEEDTAIAREYAARFRRDYEARGYTVERLDAVMLNKNKVDVGGKQQLFAYKDKSVFSRLFSFFGGIVHVDNIHYVKDDIADRGLTFTLYDPVYNTEEGSGALLRKKFSPAIMGRGTEHKYLLYFDRQFPYVHENLVTIRLGLSYTVNQNVDVADTMTESQGGYVTSRVVYPTGLSEESANDLHTATYAYAGAREVSPLYADRYTDDYINVRAVKANKSKLGYSFTIGIVASVAAYVIAVPLGILMARRKDRFADRLGTAYIVFILAVPSLAYIFIFKAIGGRLGLPTSFSMEGETTLMYLLPILSLALPSVAGLVKWWRRYTIDQMNADYVRFARAEGLSEREVFRRHILKNAAIPMLHGIPASILGCLVGAIITERVYLVPGAGNLLTTAINMNDNAVIVGLTMFYAVISIVSLILGDLLMASADPRISFSGKAR